MHQRRVLVEFSKWLGWSGGTRRLIEYEFTSSHKQSAGRLLPSRRRPKLGSHRYVIMLSLSVSA
ncbi:uncharacterized protein BCR38DRAFT_440735 [Pseudomassariella vexata]|uniref:Uncharacterized protein n=1 Tax=Pseudomassariella vexata TaxID=1141098 RepID=A0A1Y2DQR0_9PEZI|nr:uncharacterized protein BCR38DRAFT_440735 [Pseudomassariella vexata]ORY61628.1 hypothetical protein BCR38DRAFT_440735 [Pseudomassariella vexata]